MDTRSLDPRPEALKHTPYIIGVIKEDTSSLALSPHICTYPSYEESSLLFLGFRCSWLAGSEGMEKKMETTIGFRVQGLGFRLRV